MRERSRRLSVALLLAATCAVLEPSAASAAGPAPRERVVLPSSVLPERYRIDITPDAAALTFKGTVQIDIRVQETVDRIVLNGADLVLDSAALAGVAPSLPVSYDRAGQRITLHLPHRLGPGAYTLAIGYHGRIYQQGSGLFALDYASAAGQARALFTQFEDADARRFVPCWDEPARKATFELSAVVPEAQLAVSNMPVTASEALPGGLKRVHFAATPRMSSYLLFFGAGDFERIHREVEGVDVGVVVKRGDTDSARFALDVAAQALPYYNRYFDLPYPLPKLDLIAGPGSSTVFGAMENWGAIFGFERDLLIDDRISVEHDRQRVYIVVAHEMAHQWFGDLVTMQWWDDLWLNEGFATWMENKVADHFHPEWHMWVQFLGDREAAMRVDSREGTHPIITEIRDVQQADSAFDLISYQKGAAVIRELETYRGEDSFRDGVRHYMHKYAYGNTVTDDLWRAMDRDTARPITQIAHELTLQAGVPLVSELSAACADGQSTLALSQGYFAIDPQSTRARLWHVPVMLRTLGAAPISTLVFGGAPTAAQLPGCGAAILNVGQVGYFRSRYSSPGFQSIAAHYGELAAADQLGLLNDTRSLAYNGEQDMSAFMNLVANVPAGAAPEVAIALARAVQGLDLYTEGLPVRAAYRSFARKILNRFADQVGWEARAGESDNVALLRAELASTLAQLHDPVVMARARRAFEAYRADPSQLDAASRHMTLQVVALIADQSIWDQLHQLARSAPTERERGELYAFLTAAQDESLVRQGLELTLAGEPPPTIVPKMLQSAGELHPRLAFDFTVAHWRQIAIDLEPEARILFVPRLLGTASDRALIERLDAFAAAHIPAQTRMAVRKADSLIRYQARIRQQRLPELARWLAQQGSLARR